ncbi:MAG: TIGR03086 family metal-binding protein [Acidimicrobiales bacterium]
MEPLETLAIARSEFARRLRLVTAADWQRPTPCDGWTVRDLVIHVVGGDRMSAALVRGATREEATAIRKTVDLGDDAVAAFDAEADEIAAAFAEPGAFERTIAHPAGMDMSCPQLLGFRIGDYALHGWDLARAIGADEMLDDALVQELWKSISPMRPMIANSGVFGSGPSGQVSDDAPRQDRLLDLTGRRP